MANADDLIDLFAKGVRMGEDVGKAGVNAAGDLKTAARSTDGAADATRATDTAADATRATDTIPDVHGKDWVKVSPAGDKPDGKSGGFLDWVKKHPVKSTLIGGGIGTAGLVGYGMLSGGSDNGGNAREDIISPPGGKLGDAKRAVGMGDGTNGAIVSMDPAVVRQLAADLRTQADNAAALATSAPEAFMAYRTWLTRDGLGAPTRDGKASPVVADFDAALVEAEKRYIAVAQGLSAQFEGDAVKLERVATEWEDMEASNAEAINSVDAAVTPAITIATPPKDVLL
ncbi:hypothetical protein [Mycolicibacterium fortuitum]|uniref:hypothetical protein n=1 Tax=Mycolicibacterium fortuitum TaxID=1766 RepID=UPI001CDBA451|nr:hypothetical protein [Mycolicibacterium fortuitum]UBV14951.1 hypothetical protein H8Z57_30435 [Mycolicibacterium fortuitum]